jgi:hypothetical protein
MEPEKPLARYQIHFKPEPLAREEVSVCQRLNAHIAAVNLVNEMSRLKGFPDLQTLMQSLNGLLSESGAPLFGGRLEHGHIHVYPLQRPARQPDVAVISYLP